jgi:hypothetical protein
MGIDKYHMKKHFMLDITNDNFIYSRNLESINAECLLDGIYVVRTSLKDEEKETKYVAEEYKNLIKVERAFRSIKTEDLQAIPIYHYNKK